jgi:16S rRNA pseudouridine516 synthase
MSILSIDKILQSQGFGSRKYCRTLVAKGLVTINERLVEDWSESFDTDKLSFAIAGTTYQFYPALYIAMNKPPACECSRKPSHHLSVLSLLPEHFVNRDVQPVGRLDHDTTGLLLLSDDGQFIHAQSSPKKHLPKLYQAGLARPCDQALISCLLAGVQLHDEPAPLRALECRQTGPETLELVIEQGKYHQVKRMIAAAGNHCATLRRVAIGGLHLDDLKLDPGQWCLLDSHQLDLLTPFNRVL